MVVVQLMVDFDSLMMEVVEVELDLVVVDYWLVELVVLMLQYP